MTAYIIPITILSVLLLSVVRKKNAYNTFIEGSRGALSLMADVFPFLLAVMAAVELYRVSGVSAYVSGAVAPVMKFFGIPPELTELMIIRPLSGTGALAVLDGIFETYGTDSFIGLCASVVYGSSETVFYVSSIYFSKCEVKNLRYALPVALLSTFLGCVIGCRLVALIA